MPRRRPPQALRDWIDARKRHRLSDAHVQMARELGMNPKKLGKLDNHRQEPWKLPLPAFISHLYFKRFGKTRPDTISTIKEIAAAKAAKKQARRERKAMKALSAMKASEATPAEMSPAAAR